MDVKPTDLVHLVNALHYAVMCREKWEKEHKYTTDSDGLRRWKQLELKYAPVVKDVV